jgi:predicted small metal-binding protein
MEKLKSTHTNKNLKKVECGPECGFMVRSHDEDELISMTTKHAKEMHRQNVTPNEIKGMIKTAPMM